MANNVFTNGAFMYLTSLGYPRCYKVADKDHYYFYPLVGRNMFAWETSDPTPPTVIISTRKADSAGRMDVSVTGSKTGNTFAVSKSSSTTDNTATVYKGGTKQSWTMKYSSTGFSAQPLVFVGMTFPSSTYSDNTMGGKLASGNTAHISNISSSNTAFKNGVAYSNAMIVRVSSAASSYSFDYYSEYYDNITDGMVVATYKYPQAASGTTNMTRFTVEGDTSHVYYLIKGGHNYVSSGFNTPVGNGFAVSYTKANSSLAIEIMAVYMSAKGT